MQTRLLAGREDDGFNGAYKSTSDGSGSAPVRSRLRDAGAFFRSSRLPAGNAPSTAHVNAVVGDNGRRARNNA